MPRLTGSTITPQQLESHLRGTPMSGTGGSFVNAGRKYRVDPRLLVSIANAESSLGKYAQGHNPFGWGPGIHFSSWDDAIHTVAKGLRQNYLSQGLNTIAKIGGKYAPSHVANDPTNLNSNWVKNVSSFYTKLGGKNVAAAPGGPSATVDGRRPTSDGTQMTPARKLTIPAPPYDPTGLVQQSLSDIGRGRTRPTDFLNELVQGIRSQPTEPTTVTIPGQRVPGTAAAPAAPGGFLPTIRGLGGVVPNKYRTSIGGRHETSGLAGYPAVDVFAKAGSPVTAPVNGKVFKLSGHDPGQGAVQGAGGPLGWSVYIQARDGSRWYLTHMGSRNVKVGQTIKRGQVIGTVADYDKYGRASHIHVGVHRG